jgi:hypothetical protein
MTFSDIKNRVYFLTKTNSTSFPVADIVIAANAAVDHVVALINRCDSRWQWDDTNQSDLPIATTTITSGQADYSLSASHISIDRVEIKDSAGNWTLLRPKDQHDTTDRALSTTTSGIPTEYDKFGSTIMLSPVPNYTQAASLKIYFTRPPVAFDSGDTSEQPGFNPLFHDLVPLWIAYDHAIANGKKAANLIFAAIQQKEAEIREFYALRSRDERSRMAVNRESNK